MWKSIGLALGLVCLCGCFQTKDELTINADGSGTVHIETHSSIPSDMVDQIGMGSGELGDKVLYPPVCEADAKKFFPGKDFTLKTKQEKGDNDSTTTTIDVQFKDINVLLGSPYARAHQLSVAVENGALVVKAISGMEAAARIAGMKGDMGIGVDFTQMPGMADAMKQKDKMRGEFHLTLPNAITAASTNGTHDDKTATWIADRTKCKDDDEFSRQAGLVLQAQCPADGLKMSPVTPARLALCPFADLAAATSATKGAGPDTNKIAAAAKFIPYGLVVTRALDLSGSGGSPESGAQLIGAVTVPPEYAPQQWGEPKLDEVTDAKGKSLKPAESAQGEGQARMMQSRYSSMGGDAADDDDATNAPSDSRHVISLAFLPPDWTMSEIARIKGSVSLQYIGGGTQVVKLTNAVPANWIMSASSAMSGFMNSSTEKRFESQALTDLGLSLSLQMGMSQAGMTLLMLQVGGNQAALNDFQVFDASGKPWPTIVAQIQDMGQGRMCEVVVAGKPEPPLSVALIAGTGGASVEVPILLEHVNLKSK